MLGKMGALMGKKDSDKTFSEIVEKRTLDTDGIIRFSSFLTSKITSFPLVALVLKYLA